MDNYPAYHHRNFASLAAFSAEDEKEMEIEQALLFPSEDSNEVPVIGKEEDSGERSGNTSHSPPPRPPEKKTLYDDDEDEEDVCRICRNPGDADNPLQYPCACSGSIKFVHKDCLLQWLNHSNARHCEVCKHAFSFSPVYADDAPARLPFWEIVFGIGQKACHVLKFFLRLSFVLSVWLLIIPFITFWIWRGVFVRSPTEAKRLFLGHMSPTAILTDCLHGFLLSASIVFIFLGATSLRDYFRHFQEIGAQNAEREEEGDRNGVHVVRRPIGEANRNLGGEGNADDAGGAQGIAGAGQLIKGNAENVAVQWERQAARLEAHVEQMFDGLDDADGAEDVPFDELIGLHGPVFHLVENAFTVLASNFIFLVVVIFVPFSLGRLVLHYVSWIFSSAATPVLSTVMLFSESSLSLANMTLKNALTSVTNPSSENSDNTLTDQVAEMLKANVSGLNGSANINAPTSLDILKGLSAGTARLSDVTTLAVGYMLIFSLIFVYFSIVALTKYAKGEPLTMGRFRGIASMAEAIPPILWQFWVVLKRVMILIKVAFLLVVELGVFPLMCGWWLDVCTLRMFDKSMTQRVEFFSVSPMACFLVHWIVGIFYMLQISVFVSLLRGVLRQGVLYFLRDPSDPNYNPFRDLIDDPVHKHARRVLLSVTVYGSLIVLLVFLPVKLAMRIAPFFFPLDISMPDPFTEIPADVLIFQICIPFAVEHFKLRTTTKSLLRFWFTAVGWALGLTDFLLPSTEDDQDNVNDDAGRRERLHELQPGGGPQQDQAGMPLLPDVQNNEANGSETRDVIEEFDGEEQSDIERYSFVFRIVLLLVVAWMTLLVFNSALIVIPVSVGRAIFNSIHLLPLTLGVKCNDLYAFTIGSYAIWTVIAGVRYTIEQVRSRRVAVLFGQIWKWCGIVLKSSALLSLWIFVIPVLIGLLIELLVIVPMRVPIDESPAFLLYQDWTLGLIFMKMWTKVVALDQMMPLPVMDESWRVKFERVREDGFSRLQGLWVLREIVMPIILKLLTALCVPYVLARGVFPVFGYPLIVNLAVYRFAWLGCLCMSCLYICAKRFHVWFTNLHNSVRDDRYLVGRRLHNYGAVSTERAVDEMQTPR